MKGLTPFRAVLSGQGPKRHATLCPVQLEVTGLLVFCFGFPLSPSQHWSNRCKAAVGNKDVYSEVSPAVWSMASCATSVPNVQVFSSSG